MLCITPLDIPSAEHLPVVIPWLGISFRSVWGSLPHFSPRYSCSPPCQWVVLGATHQNSVPCSASSSFPFFSGTIPNTLANIYILQHLHLILVIHPGCSFVLNLLHQREHLVPHWTYLTHHPLPLLFLQHWVTGPVVLVTISRSISLTSGSSLPTGACLTCSMYPLLGNVWSISFLFLDALWPQASHFWHQCHTFSWGGRGASTNATAHPGVQSGSLYSRFSQGSVCRGWN